MFIGLVLALRKIYVAYPTLKKRVSHVIQRNYRANKKNPVGPAFVEPFAHMPTHNSPKKLFWSSYPSVYGSEPRKQGKQVN